MTVRDLFEVLNTDYVIIVNSIGDYEVDAETDEIEKACKDYLDREIEKVTPIENGIEIALKTIIKKVSFTFENLRNDLFGMDLDLTEEEYEEVCYGELPESVMKAWKREHRKAQINDWAACDYGTWKDIRTWQL